MNNTWVASDYHFSHKNITKFETGRNKFAQYNAAGEWTGSNLDAMNEAMIARHNELVAPNDTIYMLGDIAWDIQKAEKILPRMNGTKVLITGNHDNKLVKNQYLCSCFELITAYHEMRVNDTDVIMFHYPIYEWNKCHRGAVHLHGHVHGNPTGIQGRIFDVWVGGNDLYPYNLERLVEKVKRTQPIRTHGANN